MTPPRRRDSRRPGGSTARGKSTASSAQRAAARGGSPAPPVGERVESMVDPLAPLPAFHIAWNVPPFRSPDSYALDLLAIWLTDGETAPMYRELVKDRALVAQLSVGLDERRGPDLFSVFAVCAPGHPPAEARALLERELGPGARSTALWWLSFLPPSALLPARLAREAWMRLRWGPLAPREYRRAAAEAESLLA